MAKDKLSSSTARRFKKHGTKHIDYSVTLFQLYIKYKGECQSCGSITTYGVHPPVDSSATMEHKIPISKGGNHTWDNVTLFCQKCNFENNNKPIIKNNDFVKMFSLFGYGLYYKRVQNEK